MCQAGQSSQRQIQKQVQVLYDLLAALHRLLLLLLILVETAKHRLASVKLDTPEKQSASTKLGDTQLLLQLHIMHICHCLNALYQKEGVGVRLDISEPLHALDQHWSENFWMFFVCHHNSKHRKPRRRHVAEFYPKLECLTRGCWWGFRPKIKLTEQWASQWKEPYSCKWNSQNQHELCLLASNRGSPMDMLRSAKAVAH